MASLFSAPLLGFSTKRGSREQKSCTPGLKAMRTERPLEELYHIKVERNLSEKRLDELGVPRWSTWKTGKCKLPWDWHIDQLVYIEEGEVRVVPEGSERFMQFMAGDLIRYGSRLISSSMASTKRDTDFERIARTSNCALGFTL